MSDKIELRNGVIFDLDGTLVNSARDVARILNLVMAQKDVVQFSIREVERFMGDGIPATIRKALLSRQCSATQKQVAALSDAFVAIYMERPVVDTTVYPQAMDLLAGLRKRGLGIGVCTNKAEAPARLILEHTGLMTYVDALVGGDSGFGYKPKAGPLIACAQALGVAPANVLYVGDHIFADVNSGSVTTAVSVPPTVLPAKLMSFAAKPVTVLLNTTVKLIGLALVGSVWPATWLIVTLGAVLSMV